MRMHITMLLLLISVTLLSVPAFAGNDVNWSVPLNYTEITPASGVYFSMDAMHNTDLAGSWMSNASIQCCIFPGPTYTLYGWFPGIQKVQGAWFSFDSWQTRIKAVLQDKSWAIPAPIGQITGESEVWNARRRRWEKVEGIKGMSPGANGVECIVQSHDKLNRYMVGPIKFSFTGNRTTSSTNFIMVQTPQRGDKPYEQMTTLEVFGHLRGFVYGVSTMDPAIVIENNVANAAAPQPQPQPQPQAAPPPNPVQPTPQAAAPTPQPMRFAPVEPNIQVVTLVVGRGNERPREISRVTLDLAQVSEGVMIEFRWKVDAQDMKAQALVESVDQGRVKVQIVSGNWPTPGAGIWLGGN